MTKNIVTKNGYDEVVILTDVSLWRAPVHYALHLLSPEHSSTLLLITGGVNLCNRDGVPAGQHVENNPGQDCWEYLGYDGVV